jgi:hypothetical protein
MSDKVRPVLAEKLIVPLQRYAVAHNISTTAAVSLLLTKILKQEKFLK